MPDEGTWTPSWMPKQLAEISGRLERLSNGDRAVLRRMAPDKRGCDTAVLITLLFRSGVPKHTLEHPDTLRRWAHIVHVMAILSGAQGRGVHEHGFSNEGRVIASRDLGQALRKADWSETRMMRLTSARGKALVGLLSPMARYLAGKGALPLDLTPLAELVLNDGRVPERAEAARLKLATGYFAVPDKDETGKDKSTQEEFV